MIATATICGIQLTYTDVGQGTPLLCLHGGMGVDAASLRVPGILGLASHGFRLIIPDQRGHGQSSPAEESTYTHAQWATDTRELARHFGLTPFALLGHSYGGFIALEYALRWPESLSRLVLVATSAGPVRAPSREFHSDVELRAYFQSVWPLFFARADKHWPLFDALGFAHKAYNAAFRRELPKYDVRERIGEIIVPTLLIVGSRDPYRPAMEWLAERMKQATLHVLADVGHFPFVEVPDEFVEHTAGFLIGRRPSAAT